VHNQNFQIEATRAFAIAQASQGMSSEGNGGEARLATLEATPEIVNKG
jgi:hypothetical protein